MNRSTPKGISLYAALKRIWSSRVNGLGALPLFLLHVILTLFGWLIRVEGGERLGALRQPVIFALNHNNYAETFFLPCLLMHLTGRKVNGRRITAGISNERMKLSTT